MKEKGEQVSTGLPAAVKDEEGKTGRNEEQEEELEEDQEATHSAGKMQPCLR